MPSTGDTASLARSLDAFVRTWWRSQTRQAVIQAAGVDLGQTDTDVLWDLEASGASRPQMIAARVRIGAPSITKAAARLTEAGLVTAAPDPHDGRATLLSLTDAGTAVVARLRAAGDEIIGGMVTDWSAQEISEFTRLVRKLAAASPATD